MEKIGGLDVRVAHHLKKPRQRLSENLSLPHEFRREFNRWLVDFFGYEPEAFLFTPRAMGIEQDAYMVANPEAMAMLRERTDAHTKEM